MMIQAIIEENIQNELLGLGFPEPQEMDFIKVNDASLFFLGFLWELPLGTQAPFTRLDFLLGCRRVVSSRRIEWINARPVNLLFENDHGLDFDVDFWDTDGPLPSRDIVLAQVVNKIGSLTRESDS